MTNETQFDTVIKIGGSILEKGTIKHLQLLGNILSEIYQQTSNFIILGGGGIFAENVRQLQKEIHFSDETAHWMAICAMEQYALLLEEIIPQSKIVDVYNLKKQEVDIMKIPILTINDFMKNSSTLEHTWNTTSDAIACEIASYLKIPKVIFVKDVDGVFIDKVITQDITLNQLHSLKASPLDPLTPNLLKKWSLDATIISGFHPNRIKDFLNGKKVICTKIIS